MKRILSSFWKSSATEEQLSVEKCDKNKKNDFCFLLITCLVFFLTPIQLDGAKMKRVKIDPDIEMEQMFPTDPRTTRQ